MAEEKKVSFFNVADLEPAQRESPYFRRVRRYGEAVAAVLNDYEASRDIAEAQHIAGRDSYKE